jgi:alpha-1,3-glucosyltransferase
LTVATHLPIEEWYTNSTLSNVSYWPIDYPPLCMEFHYVMGKSIEVLEPEAFETQGYMEPRYKWIMRLWVIFWEYLIFIPAAYYFLNTINGKVTPYSLAIITCIPASMIVDNAHF